MIKVDARVKARADTLSGRTAFGDASESDVESDSRRYYNPTELIMKTKKTIIIVLLVLVAVRKV